MADFSQNTDPAKKQSSFLGGGPRFNAVGASYGTPGQENNSPPPAKRTGAGRTALIVVMLVLLAGALYFLSDPSLGGLVHTIGHGGISPEQAHPAPPQKLLNAFHKLLVSLGAENRRVTYKRGSSALLSLFASARALRL